MAARKPEIEIKLPVEDPERTRRLLRRLGFRCAQRRAFESNLVWDNPQGALRRGGVLLRLRQTGRRRAQLTLKGPRVAVKEFRIRPEREFQLRSFESAELLLRQMGYHPVFRYEKFRAVYQRARDRGAGLVFVDETPIGNYLELEGAKNWIRQVTRELGYRPTQALTSSYAELFSRWRRRQRGQPKHMVFRRRAG